MSHQQQLIATDTPGQLGLARSRHTLNNGDGPSNKKAKPTPRSFAHTATTEVDGGKFKCNHCAHIVSSNITRRKLHLLTCDGFLGSKEAHEAAQKDEEVKNAVEAFRAKQKQSVKQSVKRQSLLSMAGSSSKAAGSFVKQWPKMSEADFKSCRKMIATAFYTCNLPLGLIDHPDFQQMLLGLAPYMDGHLPARKQFSIVAAFCLQAQLMKYKNEPELVGATHAAVEATRAAGVKPEAFWLDLRPHAPELSQIARMLLVIPPASATSERVYSAVGRVWDTKRSRLTHPRVRKLLFIYFNKKALMRDGAARDADDFAAFEEWLDSIEQDEQQQQAQQPIIVE